MKDPIAIVGRSAKTGNYEKALKYLHIPFLTTLSIGEISHCRALLIPGGGDITPAFFGQKNTGSHQIDTELDILQLQAMEYAVNAQIPILGICKGLQIINVYFGGTLVQHMPEAEKHAYNQGDRFHETVIPPQSILHAIYGDSAVVNSAHHQCIKKTGKNLRIIQTAFDGIPEAVAHEKLPILGVQWHPERLLPFFHTSPSGAARGDLLLRAFGANAF
ncbi:MAG: gamma-glutamyl-gamma-aminobutyrate hydrolase family protein [Lachnospiraceae bacterium]|nr:gamma-glutamyl-gamma-aminobutyrate hydrolase family protein [Lachnospiraceae bacterium]